MLPMPPSRVAGGLTQSSSSSGIFFQGDGQSQNIVNSRLSSSFVNSSNTVPGTGGSNPGPRSGDLNNTVLNSVGNSAPSVGASSLVTDANSALSGGPHMQRSASINGDAYIRLPASPMSFTSNNINIAGSPVMDGSSVVQKSSHQEHSVQQLQQNQQQLQGASNTTSFPASQTGPSHQMGAQVPGSFIQDPNNISQMSKKPRLDMKQDDIVQQQVIQQLLQRQDPMLFQGRNPQLQALLQQQQQQQRLRQQHIFQSMPQLQRVQLQQQQQQQQQMQLRQQLQPQVMQPLSAGKRPYDSTVNGVCARRLMQYLYHQRQRPNDNSIAYWRKFVVEYYSPRAKKRWCLSLYNNVGPHALGVFPQAAMDTWHCDLCGSKSGRGFETTFEVLPRLNEIKFASGVIDELMFLDLPREFRFPSGVMMLEYAKAVQESVYEQLRVIREGQLRIIFTQDLKILSWEFCARGHEELLSRRLVAPQVNQLVQVAQKCQSTIAESGSDGVSQQDLQTNSNMVLTAGRQLSKSLELQSLNDFGFSKRYVRCLQISEVVNSMKDLIDICRDHKIGAIESLKNYPRLGTAAKLQMQKMQEMEQLANVQGLPTDRNTLNKLMAMNPGMNNQINNNHNMVNRGALSGSAQAALALTNYQNLLMRQNSVNSCPGSLQREGSSSFNNSNQSPSSALQGAGTVLVPGSMQNSPVSGFPSPRLPPQQQQQQHQLQQRSLSAINLLQQNHSQGSQGNQALQQQMIQQLLQEMSNNNGGGQPQSLGPTANGNMAKNGLSFAGHTPPITGGSANVAVNNGPVSRSNSFKSASNIDSPAAGGNNGFNQRASDMQQNLHFQDVQDIANEFTDNTFFNSDLDDSMGYGWKA
ncbi:probable transcriptional regulator SLK2 [Gastrolobium bilobum]|uniref:probable transcriptional regulator SLK2 n=1 Tax=Gastrolobium bilobum TaxID=150636 RepID=UPI002AB0EE86|nr:probable transcriptional regulator SLK2 [Gastrolobium bilobum]XP_061348848.1 probable transcriptional regulator SLK2 [Gastrolobium bilobum]XP_061348849.1 probable transcriptional regulator SLK2 [Gastrolobium bilobum]